MVAMSQPLRPGADNSFGGWSNLPLYRKVDELSPSDSDFVTSGTSPGDKFEVQLTEPALPPDGPRILKVRLRKTDSGDMLAVIRLLQGTKVIAARVVQPTQSFAEEAIELTPAEVQAITDYSNLRVQVQANIDTITCADCPNDTAPSAWQVVFADMTGGCAECATLNPVTLTYDGGCTWSGTVTLCGDPVQITLYHADDFWHLSVEGEGEYSVPDFAFDCLGVNVMTDFYGPGSLCPWSEQDGQVLLIPA
jgi:hypothetical protein